MFESQIMVLGASLLSLVIFNIILGSVTSLFQQQFDKVKFFQGIAKGFIITSVFVGVCYVGKMTPDIIVINVNGQDVSLYDGTYMLMMGSYVWYGKEVLVKLSGFVKGDYKVDENK